MKKFFVSAGLVAVGAASVQMAHADSGGVDSKVWSVSASLRGFYDDNYATSPNSKGSYGLEFTPNISVSAPLGQTEVGLRYIYGLYWYQEREQLNQKSYDQSHQVDVWLDHAFNERWHGRVSDTVAIAQEPAILAGGTPYRVEGNNLVNTANASLTTDWTRELSTQITLNDQYVDYTGDNTGTPSLADVLNRVDNSIDLQGQWHFNTKTTGFIGYTFDQVNYLNGGVLGVDNAGSTPYTYYSSSRDNRSHIGYVGIQQNLLANLSVTARVGGQYNDSYMDPSATTSFTPYANISATYTYLPGSYAQVGLTHELNATDEASVNANTGTLTQNQESTTLFGSINHHITPDLLGSVVAQWQNSSFNGGQYDSETDNEYNLGVSLTYNFTRHFSGDLGYNYDHLDSNVPGRGFSRNRVYLGVSAAY